MHFSSKKISLLILVVTSIICSKVFFLVLNDPEGSNLLVTSVVSVGIFFAALIGHRCIPMTTSLKRLLMAIFIQLVALTGLIFFLR